MIKSPAMHTSTQPKPAPRVFFVDDHEVRSAALQDILERDAEFKVMEVAPSGAVALELLTPTPIGRCRTFAPPSTPAHP